METIENRVYFLNIREMRSHKKFYKFIDKERQQRVGKYRFAMDKLRAIYGGILLRYAIIANTGMTNDLISFSYNPFGKPFLENSDLHVNLSHSGDFVICVISSTKVGVDIEKHTNSFNHIFHFLHEEEKKQLILGGGNKEKLFQQWCLKESYIKFIGKGLSCQLDSFKILFNEDGLLCGDNNLDYSPKFELLEISDGYSSAVCYSHGEINEIVGVSERDLTKYFN